MHYLIDKEKASKRFESRETNLDRRKSFKSPQKDWTLIVDSQNISKLFLQ